MKTKIAIVGATGKTGLPLVKLLAKENIAVKAMLHSLNNNPFKDLTNVETQVADFYNDDSLATFFKECNKAYLVTPASTNMAEIAIKVAKAAVNNGVTHIVKLSALGTSSSSSVNLLRQHAEAENVIKTMGIETTFVHPHFFLENLLQDANTIKKLEAIYSPLGDTAIAAISVKDIAASVAAILTSEGHNGKTYQLTGSKAFTYSEFAKELSQLLQTNISYFKVPFEAVYENMVHSGMPDWYAADLIELMRSWTQSKTKLVTKDVEILTGHTPIDLATFLAQYQELYQFEHHSYNDY